MAGFITKVIEVDIIIVRLVEVHLTVRKTSHLKDKVKVLTNSHCQ